MENNEKKKLPEVDDIIPTQPLWKMVSVVVTVYAFLMIIPWVILSDRFSAQKSIATVVVIFGLLGALWSYLIDTYKDYASWSRFGRQVQMYNVLSQSDSVHTEYPEVRFRKTSMFRTVLPSSLVIIVTGIAIYFIAIPEGEETSTVPTTVTQTVTGETPTTVKTVTEEFGGVATQEKTDLNTVVNEVTTRGELPETDHIDQESPVTTNPTQQSVTQPTISSPIQQETAATSQGSEPESPTGGFYIEQQTGTLQEQSEDSYVIDQ